MEVKIINGQYYYKDMVGEIFDVSEELGSLYEGIYFINGKEEDVCNWFSKKDCEILDEEYLNALKVLKMEDRLKYYQEKSDRYEIDIKLYEDGNYKEEFKGQTEALLIGSLSNKISTDGKIELLKNLLGIKPFV